MNIGALCCFRLVNNELKNFGRGLNVISVDSELSSCTFVSYQATIVFVVWLPACA